MNIKYHQHGIEPEYVNHILSDNWDPDKDYGNEYVKAYFHIDTPSYHYSDGFSSGDAQKAWHKEVSNLLFNLGILEDCGFAVEHATEKQAYLHAHPQELSGVVRKNDVKRIAEAINGMQLSSIRYVALHATVYDITDEEYSRILEREKKDDVRVALFRYAETSKRTLFKDLNQLAASIADKHKLPRLGIKEGYTGQTVRFVEKVAHEMTLEGYLVETEQNGRTLVRSSNKTEIKQKKLAPLPAA